MDKERQFSFFIHLICLVGVDFFITGTYWTGVEQFVL